MEEIEFCARSARSARSFILFLYEERVDISWPFRHSRHIKHYLEVVL